MELNDPLAQDHRGQSPASPAPQNKKMDGRKRRASSPGTKIEVPLDIALSLLRPDELEKLKNYVAAYLAKYGSEIEEAENAHSVERDQGCEQER